MREWILMGLALDAAGGNLADALGIIAVIIAVCCCVLVVVIGLTIRFLT